MNFQNLLIKTKFLSMQKKEHKDKYFKICFKFNDYYIKNKKNRSTKK